MAERCSTLTRLAANGNGEVKCVVLAYSFEEAKLGLMPYASSIVKSYPFISAFGAQVNVHDVRDLERLPFVKAVAAHTTVTICGDGFRLCPPRLLSAKTKAEQTYAQRLSTPESGRIWI